MKKSCKSVNLWISIGIIILSCVLTLNNNVELGYAKPRGIFDYIFYGYASRNFIVNAFCPLISLMGNLSSMKQIEYKKADHLNSVLLNTMLTNSVIFLAPMCFWALLAIVFSKFEAGSFIIWGTFETVCQGSHLAYIVLFVCNTLVVSYSYLLLGIALKLSLQRTSYCIIPMIVYNLSSFLPDGGIFGLIRLIVPSTPFNISTIKNSLISHCLSIVFVNCISLFIIWKIKKCNIKMRPGLH